MARTVFIPWVPVFVGVCTKVCLSFRTCEDIKVIQVLKELQKLVEISSYRDGSAKNRSRLI